MNSLRVSIWFDTEDEVPEITALDYAHQFGDGATVKAEPHGLSFHWTLAEDRTVSELVGLAWKGITRLTDSALGEPYDLSIGVHPLPAFGRSAP